MLGNECDIFGNLHSLQAIYVGRVIVYCSFIPHSSFMFGRRGLILGGLILGVNIGGGLILGVNIVGLKLAW